MNTPFHLLKLSALVESPNFTTDTDGSQKINSWSTVAAALACALQPSSSRDAVEYKRETGKQLLTLYADPATPILKGYRVTINAVRYRVVGPSMDYCMAGVLSGTNLETDS